MTKGEIKKLDKAWSLRVKELAHFRCQYCLKENVHLNSAHIIGRRNHSVRWDVRNGMCLCYNCHMAYDHHLPLHKKIYDSLIGDIRWEHLEKEANIKKKLFYDEVLERIKL